VERKSNWGLGGKATPTIANRTEVFDNSDVKGSEFLRKVKAVARRKKLAYRWVPERGSAARHALRWRPLHHREGPQEGTRPRLAVRYVQATRIRKEDL